MCYNSLVHSLFHISYILFLLTQDFKENLASFLNLISVTPPYEYKILILLLPLKTLRGQILSPPSLPLLTKHEPSGQKAILKL